MAKYVSETHDIQVVICDCPGPQIFLEEKRIELPNRIREENVFGALSSLMHEAAHMKYTKIPKEFQENNIDFYIVNALEDIRIDLKNYRLLPNVFSFYKTLTEKNTCSPENKASLDKQSLFVRCMVQLILVRTHFLNYCWDDQAIAHIQAHKLHILAEMGVDSIERKNWKELRNIVDKIKSAFKFEKPDKKQFERDKSGKAGSKKSGSKGSKKSSSNKTAVKPGKSKEPEPGKDIGSFIRPQNIWDKGDLSGESGKGFSTIQLTETTKKKLIECLNIKEKHTVDDGSQLDTGNLIAFFTGQIKELFKEDTTEVVKKSKIVFCLDASSSMNNRLVDGNLRNKVLICSIQSMIDVLNEVRETEGLNIDYDIIGFNHSAHLLTKERWRDEYEKLDGTTNILNAVNKSIEILSNNEIEGNKFIVLVTDGEVKKSEIIKVQDSIMKNNSDIKAMLIGIAGDPTGYFVNNLCGDNILCMDHAEQILMESIQTLLERR